MTNGRFDFDFLPLSAQHNFFGGILSRFRDSHPGPLFEIGVFCIWGVPLLLPFFQIICFAMGALVERCFFIQDGRLWFLMSVLLTSTCVSAGVLCVPLHSALTALAFIVALQKYTSVVTEKKYTYSAEAVAILLLTPLLFYLFGPSPHFNCSFKW